MSPGQHAVYIVFLFALGACVGSFLNVVVWRLPRGESLVTPPSRCPKCEHRLAWYDNVPVFGWLMLKGKCRYCGVGISARYPIVEFVTGGLFAFYYVMIFMGGYGPCVEGGRVLLIQGEWPIFGMYLFAVGALLAASLIDAELYIIPPGIPWLLAGVGVAVHGIVDRPGGVGALNLGTGLAAVSAGGVVGVLIAIGLLKMKVLPLSFPLGEPILDVDREMVEREIAEAKRKGEEAPAMPPPYTAGGVRREMGKEVLFLMPAVVLGLGFLFLTKEVAPIESAWGVACSYHWLTGLLGACLGAMTGAVIIWAARIIGTLIAGRVAMGLGDVHLMLGIGAVVGSGGAVIAFFLAPFFGLGAAAIYFLSTGKRREIPFGPSLSLGTAATILFYCPIAHYLAPGLEGLVSIFWGGM